MNILEQLGQLLGDGQQMQPAPTNMLTAALQGGPQQSQTNNMLFPNSMRDALAKLSPNQLAGPIPNSPPPSAFGVDPKAYLQPAGHPTGGASGSWGAPEQPAASSGIADFVTKALGGFGAPQADAPEALPEIDVQTGVPIPPSRPADMGSEVRTQPTHANAQANKPAGNAFDKLLPVPIPPSRPADMGNGSPIANSRVASAFDQTSPIPLPPVRPADMGGGAPMPVGLNREVPRPTGAPNGAAVMAGFGSEAATPAANTRPGWNPRTDMPPELQGKAVNAGSPIGGRSTSSTSPAALDTATGTSSGWNPEPLRRWANSVFTGMAMGRNLGDGLRQGAALAYQDQATQRTEGTENQTRAVGRKLGLDPDLLKSLNGQQLASYVIQAQQARLKATTPEYEFREVNGVLGRFNKNDPSAAFQPVEGAPRKAAPAPLSAEERTFWGIPADDKRPYAKDENGKPSLIGGAGTTVNIGDSENGKLPSGYRWKDENNKNAGVVPIPGGPATQIPAETAARFGLANKYLGSLQDGEGGKPGLLTRLRKGGATGPLNYPLGQMFSSSEAADIVRQQQEGADALQRFLTGAGMGEGEAKGYAMRYGITPTDTAASAARKAEELGQALNSMKEAALRGRGDEGNTPITPTIPQPSGSGGSTGGGTTSSGLKWKVQ